MLPSLASLEAAPSSQNRRTNFTSSQQHANEAGSPPWDASQVAGIQSLPHRPALDECTSVGDLLTFFSTSHLPVLTNGDCASVPTSTPSPSCRELASLCLPSSWESNEMRQVRKVIVALLRDILDKCPKQSGASSPVSSVGSLLVFLVIEEQGLLRAVCQRSRAAIAAELRTRCASLGGSNDATHRTVTLQRSGSLEHEALAFLMQCASYLLLREREKADKPLGKGSGSVAVVAVAVATNSNGYRGLFGCSALSLLQTSINSINGKNGINDYSSISAVDDAPYWCSTGCEGLDRALGGAGFRSGWVTEVYGEAGAGKTQLGLQCLLEQSAADLCRDAVALCLAHHPPFAALLEQTTNGVAHRCKEMFDLDRVAAARCAVVYLVSEDVPASRLGPLAIAAVRRAVRAVQLHPVLTQLPSNTVEAVLRCVRQSCTVAMVLTRLQIRHVSSLQEVLGLLEPTAEVNQSAHTNRFSSSGGKSNNGCSLDEAVHMWGGALGRALIVFDSAAAAVVAGQVDMNGTTQVDTSVAAAAVRLRRAAEVHNWCVIVTNQVRAVPSSVRSLPQGVYYGRLKRARSPNTASSSSSSTFSTAGYAGSGSHVVVPALGFAWSGVAQCRVYLRKSLSLGVRQLVLRHSPAYPPSQVSYVITQSGIEDA